LARSFSDAPSARSDRTSRSSDTDGSPVSILATRDWLDLMSFAKSVCVSFRRCRRLRRLSLSRSFISTYEASSGVRSRKSSALPTLHPFFSNSVRRALRIIVFLQAPSCRFDDGLGRLCRLLLEYLGDDHRVGFDSVDYSPGSVMIDNSKFVAPSSDRRHWARMWHGERVTSLKSPQQESRLQARRLPKGRRPHLAFEPDQGFISRAHSLKNMSDMAYCQAVRRPLSNKALKLSVRSVTVRAGARPAPDRPAA
jgi:hypothetical protein